MKRLAILLLFLPLGANAIPIDYDMTYTADAGGGPDGVGSFTFDSDTNFLSGLNWLFDDGLSGLYFDTVDQFLGSLVLLRNCSTGCASTRGGSSISGDFSSVRWDYNFNVPGGQTYSFFTASGTEYFGTYAVTRATAVPEPGTLALLIIGLLGIGLARRRRTP